MGLVPAPLQSHTRPPPGLQFSKGRNTILPAPTCVGWKGLGEVVRGLERGAGHRVDWQAAPRPTSWPHPRPASAAAADTLLRPAQGVEARRPRSDRSQMQCPGIPGRERWAEVGPVSQGLQLRPRKSWVWEVRPQARDGQGSPETWAPGIPISENPGVHLKGEGLGPTPACQSAPGFSSGVLYGSSKETVLRPSRARRKRRQRSWLCH